MSTEAGVLCDDCGLFLCDGCFGSLLVARECAGGGRYDQNVVDGGNRSKPGKLRTSLKVAAAAASRCSRSRRRYWTRAIGSPMMPPRPLPRRVYGSSATHAAWMRCSTAHSRLWQLAHSRTCAIFALT